MPQKCWCKSQSWGVYYFQDSNRISGMCSCITHNIRWIKELMQKGEELVFISDMYLPKAIIKIMAMDTGRVEVGDYFFQTVNGCIRKYGKELITLMTMSGYWNM